ncbi:putative ADP-ribosylation factor-related protein 1-like isoform X1, partial [Apostichopus japonicus]
EMLKSEALYSVPVLVLGNKQDLEGCLSVSDIKKEFNKSSSLIGKRDCHIQASSGLTGLATISSKFHVEGVDDGINWVVQCVQRNVYRSLHAQRRLVDAFGAAAVVTSITLAL